VRVVPLTLSPAVPDDAARQAIRALAADVERSDGAPPLSDQALSRLSDPGAVHVRAYDSGRLAGYGQRAGAVAEVLAAAGWADPLVDATVVPGVLIWTHGSNTPLIGSLTARGFARVRELYLLERPLDAAHPLPADPPLADGVVVRPFRPGADDEAWLALNAAAFASHPEQGQWTSTDLHARMTEDWFDPAGFLLAERSDPGGGLLGFHWTKVHADGAGEVYVLGVSPAAQGLGLGNSLLVRGLRHLAGRGCPHVRLYVDGDNAGALRLYERSGFVPANLDVQWRAPGAGR
jgi:mycothiol synthase